MSATKKKKKIIFIVAILSVYVNLRKKKYRVDFFFALHFDLQEIIPQDNLIFISYF